MFYSQLHQADVRSDEFISQVMIHDDDHLNVMKNIHVNSESFTHSESISFTQHINSSSSAYFIVIMTILEKRRMFLKISLFVWINIDFWNSRHILHSSSDFS